VTARHSTGIEIGVHDGTIAGRAVTIDHATTIDPGATTGRAVRNDPSGLPLSRPRPPVVKVQVKRPRVATTVRPGAMVAGRAATIGRAPTVAPVPTGLPPPEAAT